MAQALRDAARSHMTAADHDGWDAECAAAFGEVLKMAKHK